MGAAVCQLAGVEPTNNQIISGTGLKNDYTTAGDLTLMQKSDRKFKDKRQLKRLVSEAVAELVKAADGVFMTLTQAGSPWRRAVVNATEVCAVDEAAAALEVEILPAWTGNAPCNLAGVGEPVKAAHDGVFMILTQAGSAWGRAVVNAAEVCAVDEAAAALEAEILPAWKADTPCILAGDPAQLPPPVFSDGVKDSNENPVNELTGQLKLSMLKRLDDIAWPCWEQKHQLRMAPGGFEPPNAVFYDGRIKTSPDLKLEDFPEAILFEEWAESLNSQGMAVPAEAGKSTITASPIGLVWPFMVDAQDTFCFREVGGTSKGNTQMASLVPNYIRSFLAFGKGRIFLHQIAVIVPYLQQRELYLKTVAENEEFKGLIVATANTYQGHENTYVFFHSTAAANLDGKVGFIDDSNSLAVATTRHRCGLAVFGDSRTYSTTIITETNEGGDDTDDEDEDEEDGVDEAETKNSESTSKLQQLFAWFAESGRVVSESAGNPPGYICKQITKETHEEARRKQKAREQQGDEHLFGDFTATDPDDENSNQQRNNQQPLRAPTARANEISQHQHTLEESSSSTRPDAKPDFLQDLQANQKVMDALGKIGRQEDFRPNDFNPLLPYHILLRESGVPTSHFTILPLKSGSRWNGRATFIFALTTL